MAKKIDSEIELHNLVQEVEELFRLQDLQENSNNAGLRHNVMMQVRKVKTVIAQYRMLRQAKKKTKTVFQQSSFNYKFLSQ